MSAERRRQKYQDDEQNGSYKTSVPRIFLKNGGAAQEPKPLQAVVVPRAALTVASTTSWLLCGASVGFLPG